MDKIAYFSDYQSLVQFIIDSCSSRHIESVRLSTYGMYVGILHTGEDVSEKYPMDSRVLLDYLDTNHTRFKTRILIGKTFEKPCREGCLSCRNNFEKNRMRLDKTLEAFPHVNFHISDASHAKTTLIDFSYKRIAIFGGFNLSTNALNDNCIAIETQDGSKFKEVSDSFDTMFSEKYKEMF